MIPGRVAADFRIQSRRSIRAFLDLRRAETPAHDSAPAFPAVSEVLIEYSNVGYVSCISFLFNDRRAVLRSRA